MKPGSLRARPAIPASGRVVVSALTRRKFVVDRPKRAPVRPSDDVRDPEPFAIGVPFDEDAHIDVLELVESAPPITVSLDVWLFLHSGGQTVDDKSGERELRSSLCLDRPEAVPGIGDIDFDGSVNITPVTRHPHVIHRQLLRWRHTPDGRALTAHTLP